MDGKETQAGGGGWWQGPRIWLAALLFPAAYAAMAYWWYMPFIHGDLPGPYWLLVIGAWTPIPLMIVCILLIPAAILARAISRAALKQTGRKILWHPLAAAILAGIALIPASFPLKITPTRHLESVAANGKQYHLAAIHALIDINYGVYECGGLGLWCSQRSRSGDFSASSAHFERDPSGDVIRVVVCETYAAGIPCRVAYEFEP